MVYRVVSACRRAVRGVPVVVWLMVALYLLVMLWQTAAFPNFRSPDEKRHVDLIVMTNLGHAWPWPDQGTLGVSRGSAAGGFTTTDRIRGRIYLSGKDIPARGARPSYLDAGGADTTRQARNQLVQHPPLYYVAGAGVLALIPDWQDAPFDRVYLVLRFWNAILLAPLPLLFWAIARRLGLPDPVPVAASVVPLAIPELTRAGSSVNNDNLLVILVTLLTLLVVRVLTGDTSRRTAVAIGALTSLALLTKFFALVLPAWVLLAYLLAARRSGRRPAVESLALALLTALPGLAWWIRNKFVYGAVQPQGDQLEDLDRTPLYDWSDGGWVWLKRFVERMNTLFFVHDQTGHQLRTWPWWVAVLAAVLVLLGLAAVLALRVLPRATTLTLLVPVTGALAMAAAASWVHFAATHQYAGMQGRYLHMGVAGLGVAAVASTARLPARVRRLTPLALLGFAALMQAVYLTYTLWLFWSPREIPQLAAVWQSLDGILRWYPLPPAVVLTVLVATAAMAAATVATLARHLHTPPHVPQARRPGPESGVDQGVGGVARRATRPRSP